MIMERGFMNKEEIIKSAIILAVFLGVILFVML